ncbi:MAG: hypothetical protein Q8Q85_15160 [Gemmatimonadales bacterium]|nr:hypothetical protein [Gemmatimonadales bacterium]
MATRARKPAAKRTTKDFGATLAGLEKILSPYGKKLTVSRSASYGLTLLGNPTKTYPGGLMFAAAAVKKNYVSYHLMPVYMLQGSISPALKARMQGKACFNFTAPDAVLFKELADLTRRGYEGFRKMGYVP